MIRRATILGWAAAVGVGAAPLGAQSWRTLDVSRQLTDSAPLAVQVVYGTGEFGLRATSAPLLYHMALRYDGERHELARDARKLRLGLSKSDVRFTGREDGQTGELQLELSRHAPIDLALELGAVEADMDLTGLRLTRLRVESGASETRLRFDSLNAARMSVLEISLGAANFRAYGLANANASDVRIDAGAGNIELDLGGQWTRDIELRVEVTLGLVTVHVPADVGVRVSVRKVIASFDHEGLVQRDGAWVSSNWDSAPHKLRISSETILGKLKIDRTGR
jgi:hypothetical protein